MSPKQLSRPFLSICIPTFERSDFLDYLLSNIIEQIGANSGETQVIVSDNNSQDSTLSVIEKYQKMSLNLKYVRHYKNLGFTENLNSAVSAANGQYCWLFGDDDAFRHGSIAFMQKILNIENPDVAISNRFVCDFNMNPSNEEKIFPSAVTRQVFDFNDRSSIIEYFSNNRNTNGIFNFISTIIIKKESWLKANEKAFYSKTLFPHTFKVVDILYNNLGRLLFIPEATVFARTGNDRLQEVHEGSNFKAWQLHFSGNIEVADYYFKHDSHLYNQFLHPIRNIISNGLHQYISLAKHDGFVNEAVLTLKKLNIDLPDNA